MAMIISRTTNYISKKKFSGLGSYEGLSRNEDGGTDSVEMGFVPDVIFSTTPTECISENSTEVLKSCGDRKENEIRSSRILSG